MLPYPWLICTEPLRLTDQVPATFIECVSWMRVFIPHAEGAAARGWPVHELVTGQEAMVAAPEELAALLTGIAAT